MRYLLIFIPTLFLGCSEDEGAKPDCRLVKIVLQTSTSTTQTDYTYHTNGKMARQVQTFNGTPVYDYIYSYNPDGKVDKVDMGEHYTQYEYAADGRLASITKYTQAGAMTGKNIYTWTGNNVEITLTRPESPNPYQTTEFEFLNQNLVRRIYRTYTGNEPNELKSVTESTFEDFDTALSAFYIASSTRPGYTPETSKNNPGKEVNTSVSYSGGSVTMESTYTTIFTYTYNAANAVITSKSVTNQTIVVDTVITYDDQCI
jgi:hypothetical protein